MRTSILRFLAASVVTGCFALPFACSTTSKSSASIAGQVVDLQGAPIANVRVSGGGGSATTGADGRFSFGAAEGKIVVAFVAQGYVRSHKSIVVSGDGPARVFAVLPKQGDPQPLDATAGGTVTGPRGSVLTAPAGAFVDRETGAAVSGMITVALTPLDPSVAAELRAFPGKLVGKHASGAIAQLVSYSVVDVEAEQNGRRLTVKPGMQLSLTMPGRASGGNPQSTWLWSLDETDALWKEEGTATLDVGKGTYAALLPHLCPYNVDGDAVPGCVKGRVVDCSGTPVYGLNVLGYTRQTSSLDETDRYGRFSIPGEQGQPLTLEIYGGDLSTMLIVKTTNGTDTPADLGNLAKDDPACRQLGDVVYGSTCEQGLKNPPDAGSTPNACTQPDGGSGLEGTCAAGVGDVFKCMNMGASCTMSSSGSELDMVYDNGSKIVWVTTGGKSTGTIYDPSGKVCGTLESSGESDFSITSADGKTWSFTQNGQVVKCPDGTTQNLTASQQSSFKTCSSSVTSAGSSCKVVTPGGCASAADCPTDANVCCQTKGGNQCVKSQGSCDQLKTLACGSDADCTSPTKPKCCSGALVKMCLPLCM